MDTYSGTASDPLSLNLYTYCLNNPLVYYDPTGHLAVTAYINGVQITFDPTYKDIKTNSNGTSEYFGTSFVKFVYEESNKVNIKDSSYYYNMWSTPEKKVSVFDSITDGNVWKEAITDAGKSIWNGTKNFFVDIFTDEDRTDKSMFSYTPETKAKYDAEKIDRWIRPGGSTDADFLNETKKAFGEIKDYAVDKGTDQAAQYVLGKGIETAAGPIIGSIMKKSTDEVVEDTLILYGKGVKSVPGIRKEQFNKWFNSLTPDELDELWKNPTIRETIENRLRKPGKLHEWHLVSRTPTFKKWGVTAEQIKDMRTLTEDTKFINPKGIHGGEGSTTAHNELLSIIDSSENYNMFKRRLQNWADFRLEGGADALPGNLKRQ